MPGPDSVKRLTARQSTVAKFKVLLGFLCLATLVYWIFALHFSLPGSGALHAAYEATYRNGRRGSWPFWLLSMGGILLVGWGLADLGILRDDPS
ncbi:MAG: hypothetical protein IT363_04355 [Methanoregulaceae archaeon]|nr:hypothetical protein [Methanoregulaceae archaeon]